jgi:Lysyl oxidase
MLRWRSFQAIQGGWIAMQQAVPRVGGKRRRGFIGLAMGLTFVVAMGLVGARTFAAAATLGTPHLRNAKLGDIRIDTSTGRRLLRYTTKIINVGDGAFELQGTRSSTTSPWTVQQRLYNSDGTVNSTVTTNVTLFYAGDGHNHWHVQDLELGDLTRRDNGVKVGTSAKRGFCFYDNIRYNSSAPAYYLSSTNSCAMNNPDALSVMMGLSLGWGDVYVWSLGYQYIDITGLGSGRYRLTERVNPSLGLSADLSDNETWVDLRLTGSSVRVEAYGPGL